MTVSIVVCTHNRAESLRDALQSVVSQDYPALNYEIIVVDNCSTDNTKHVVEEFADNKLNNANIRYVNEERLGLSYARNRGIEEAKGEIIAFIDDDAKADRFWLSRLTKVYSEEKDAACVGGRVILDWNVNKPSWWEAELDEVFNGINYSDSKITLSYPHYPYGTNISFRANVLKKVGLFKTDLGRIGSKLLAGEETELCLRIEKEGYKICYEPNAIVWHRVDPDKLSKSYIRKRAIWHGMSHALLELKHFGPKHVKERSIWHLRSIYRWLKRGQYNLVEQKRYLFEFGYFLQGMIKRPRHWFPGAY
jgi:glycosyltransferase involved in cell wall biosynthesis